MDVLSPEWVQHMIQVYGLWIVFAAVMLESMGMPMPGETALVTAALYAGTTQGIAIHYVIIVGAIAAIAGDNLGYLIGRFVGLRLLRRYGKYVRLHEARLKVGQYLFLRHGGKIVFFGRFVAFLRAFAAILAGANRMPWLHFLVMNALGGVCWASLFGIGAYIFGERIKAVAGPVSAGLLIGAICLLIVGAVFFRRHEQALEARAEKALSRT